MKAKKTKNRNTDSNQSKADEMKNNENNKLWGKFENLNEKLNIYLFIPLSVIIALAWLGVYFKNSILGLLFNIGLTIIFIVWLVYLGLFITKKIAHKQLYSILGLGFVCIFVSFITEKSKNISLFLFVMGVILIEVYLLFVIIYYTSSKDKKLNYIIYSSITFIVLGYVTIYLSSYGKNDNTVFNSLISLFSAIVGGGLTLGGVAWTIKHEKEIKEKEEMLKVKPFFTFNLLYGVPQLNIGEKACSLDNLELNYICRTYSEIENSNQSVLILKKIFHDKKWFNLEFNNVVIPSGKLFFNFNFNDPENIILEISDVLGNLYYYKLSIIHTALIGGEGNGVHTISGFTEISNNEVKITFNEE